MNKKLNALSHFLYLCLLITPGVLCAQEAPSFFLKNLCEYKTDGTSKYGGLIINLSVPCKWKEEKSKMERILKKFSYDLNSFNITQTLMISSLKKSVKVKSTGTPIIQISGINGSETVQKVPDETPYGKSYSLFFFYDFVYKNKFIEITYSIVSVSKSLFESASIESYTTLFRALITNSKFLN